MGDFLYFYFICIFLLKKKNTIITLCYNHYMKNIHQKLHKQKIKLYYNIKYNK